jgi:hypothetical protein
MFFEPCIYCHIIKNLYFFFLYVLIIYIWITVLMYRDIFTSYIMTCCLLIVYVE